MSRNTEAKAVVTMRLRDGVPGRRHDASLYGPRTAVLRGALPPAGPDARESVKVAEDTGKPTELLGRLAVPDPDFAVVTP